MKEVLIIHCKLSVYAGGEYLCFCACKVLQDRGYHINLLSDVFEPSKAEALYGMGTVLSKCTHIPLPRPATASHRSLLVLEQLIYTIRLARFATALSKGDFDFVLNTQSSVFSFHGKRLYHFVYELTDLFSYPVPVAKDAIPRGGRGKRIYFSVLKILYAALAQQPRPTSFFVTGHGVLRSLRTLGFTNSSFVYPPSRVFKPGIPKKPEIVQACRIAPEKRLEFMFDAARRLPQYKFCLVGRDSEVNRLLNPGYAQRVLANLPPNVTYIQSSIRERPELLTYSQVYFHTGLEKGMLLVLMEAMSAGCILVVPEHSVAGEIVRASQIGYTYRTIEQAADKLRIAMDKPQWNPSEISLRAKQFGPEAFETLIRSLGEDQVGPSDGS
ncbi:glycosyltransferase [Candidatus Bathyarchaeota archaeon]|nr:MAG: glycosyltransferase [Candidatus Bathyarchaeota archaeon]